MQKRVINIALAGVMLFALLAVNGCNEGKKEVKMINNMISNLISNLISNFRITFRDEKRAQVALFIILGILIVAVVVLFFVFKNDIIQGNVPKEFESVYSYYLIVVFKSQGLSSINTAPLKLYSGDSFQCIKLIAILIINSSVPS